MKGPSSLPTYLSQDETTAPPVENLQPQAQRDKGWGVVCGVGGLGATAENHAKLSPQCLFLHFAL